MNTPKVSVIVPVYNVEKYLDRCLNSLLNQTLRDIEIILVDDGSPDNSPAICDDYAHRYSNIQVIHKANAGLGMACNSGLEIANGTYVAFCDSDDWVDSDMYETMYQTSVNYKADVVYTGLKRVDGLGIILDYMHHPNKFQIYTDDTIKELAYDMISSSPNERYDHKIQVSAKTALYRLDLLRSNSIRFVSEREYPSEDLIFNVSVLTKARIACVIPKYFYNYFVNDNSITTTIKEQHFIKMIRSASLLREITKENDSYNDNDINRPYTRITRFMIAESRSFSKQIINSSLNHRTKREMIKGLSLNQSLTSAVKEYPVHLMPFIHRIALFLLLNNQFRALQVIYKFS